MDHEDSLYCNEEEEKWGDDFADSMPAVDLITNSENEKVLVSLLSKEKQEEIHSHFAVSSESRREAVEWIIKVNGYYGFSTLTAILAVNYLDRFVAGSVHFDEKKQQPWLIHLASVSSLSLAAKVEETYVPLLLDFQVLGSKYVFEANAIQKMELLMLSTLKWRMNVVTPLSFLEHIITSLGLKNNNGGVHCDFLRRFERLLLAVVVDWRMVRYEASVLATSSMLHVIHEIEPCINAIDCYHNKLLHLLNLCKMKVKECSELISEIVSSSSSSSKKKSNKRKTNNNNNVNPAPSSPIDAFSSSNDSWAVSSPPQPNKKVRTQQQHMRLPSNNSLFLEVVATPY